MDRVQEWVPTEAEVPADHWSKSSEYLAEKEKAVHPGQGFVITSNIKPADRSTTTHDQMKSNFQVEYVPTEAELASKSEIDIYEQMAIDLLANVEKALKEKDA